MKDVLKKINDLEDLIGHTPLIEISFRYNQKKHENLCQVGIL